MNLFDRMSRLGLSCRAALPRVREIAARGFAGSGSARLTLSTGWLNLARAGARRLATEGGGSGPSWFSPERSAALEAILARPLPALLRPAPLVLGALWLVQCEKASTPPGGEQPDLSRALVSALKAQSVLADPGEVFWLDAPQGYAQSLISSRRALLRGRHEGDPADIYLTTVRVCPEGRLLDLTGVYNLTETSAVDEHGLVVSANRAAWSIGTKDATDSFHYADLSGQAAPTGDGWSAFKRWQNAITNVQETGQLAGVGRRSFKLDPPATKLTLSFSDGVLSADADGREIRVPTGGGAIDGQRFVKEQAHHVALPGNLVTWSVDRVRALPWFGSDRMQLVKAVAFAGLDWTQSVVGSVTGDDGSQQVADELGDLVQLEPPAITDPETGWPPRRMTPISKNPLEREGEWIPLENDPFVRKNPGAPAPFVTSFIRADPSRAYSQVFVTMWDPRQVLLHTMSGTVEPKSATGETGPGLVPRKPEVMGRLLAGLNGGFQATHGEFGMMAEDVMYLPPKPFAATVTVMRDGSNGFGTWAREETVPDEIVGFRQNMTPLMQDGVKNPYKRYWWGGVPPGWTDESRTCRSGICLTEEGFVAYFYGTSIDADHLAAAMKAARCNYGIHLDMNAGHTGLEFYQAGPEAELPPLDRALDRRWEAEGPLPEMPGWRFRGRRMLRFMGLMNFPRYIDREARDFFYLTLRHIVPGDDLAPPDAAPGSEGKWAVQGLPQHGWPHAIARTFVRPDPTRPDARVQLLQMDPRMLRVAETDDKNAKLVFAVAGKAGETKPTSALWMVHSSFVLAEKAPVPDAVRVFEGLRADDAAAGDALAAAGVGRGGMLFYAEITSGARAGQDGALLKSALARLDVKDALFFTRLPGVAIGGALDVSGHPIPLSRKSVRFTRAEAPAARRIFKDTPVVEPDVWHKLQAKRVRYFKKPQKKEESSASGKETASTAESLPAEAQPKP